MVMVSSWPSPSRSDSIPGFVVCALTVVLAAAHVGAASVESRITNASTVRLRSAPSNTASITAELSLGTELVVLERTTQAELWYHVRTDDGRNGWVLGSLTAPFDRDHLDEAIESIVVERLSSGLQIEGTTFSTHLQLFDLIERTAERLNEREAQARFALYRLRSMNNAFRNVPFRRGDSDPYRAWIREHQDAARYNEPAGQWMVNPSYVMQIHEKYRAATAADDIAWFFVENGLYGECEGDVPCYVTWQNALNGEYLRLYPRGRHADESNADIARRLNAVMDTFRGFPLMLNEFNHNTWCGELHMSLDPLLAAVTTSTSVRKADALAAIDRFAQLCR
jgi:hypothetical protein